MPILPVDADELLRKAQAYLGQNACFGNRRAAGVRNDAIEGHPTGRQAEKEVGPGFIVTYNADYTRFTTKGSDDEGWIGGSPRDGETLPKRENWDGCLATEALGVSYYVFIET